MNYRLPQWQALKNAKPMFNATQLEIAIAMVLTDATMARVSTQAYMKIEQGYKQLEFVEHLWSVFKDYCWGDSYHTRKNTSKDSPRFGLIKSYWFKTFSHAALTQVYELCFLDGKKTILPGIIRDYITGLGLAYMIMADGSLGKDNIMILHLQGFTQAENQIVSSELNKKFGLHSEVIVHKIKYFVVKIPSRDAATLRTLIAPHMLPMFVHKIPR